MEFEHFKIHSCKTWPKIGIGHGKSLKSRGIYTEPCLEIHQLLSIFFGLERGWKNDHGLIFVLHFATDRITNF